MLRMDSNFSECSLFFNCVFFAVVAAILIRKNKTLVVPYLGPAQYTFIRCSHWFLPSGHFSREGLCGSDWLYEPQPYNDA